MTVVFRQARRDDVPSVIALLVDDMLGQGREASGIDPYLAAFDRMSAEGNNLLVIGEDVQGRVVATYQITFINGLSMKAARRAQVESVRVASDRRGGGIGTAMFADAEARARKAGCSLIQLTMNQTRTDAQRFYERLGFTASHIGFKRYLD